MLHDEAEDLRLQDRPVLFIGLGDGHEIAAEEDARDATDAEQALCQRRARGLVGGIEIGGPTLHHHTPGKEFQRGGIRGLFVLMKISLFKEKRATGNRMSEPYRK